MSLLLKWCPSYQARWDHYIHNSYVPGEVHLLYIDLADFSNHIVVLYKQNQTNEFPAVFNVIELLHTNGDDAVREAATIGLLEDMQNKLLDSEMDMEAFKQFLKNDSLKWWNHLNEFWDGNIN